MSGFVFSEKPIEIETGEGAYLYDTDGTAYMDAGASYACTPAGHCPPSVVEAIQEQAERLLYVQASYPTAPRTELFDALTAVAPGDCERVWLCNSGTEANEAALKFARSATDRTTFVAATRGFHGRTMGTLSTTWRNQYKKAYEPLLEDVTFVPYGDEEELAAAVDGTTAAVILEPIQGEGGVHAADAEYLRTAREVTTDADAALVFDEIQTGLGRTGTMWACEAADVVPDVLTVAKGLASGLPIGATLCRDWIAEGAASHGSTFSGNPLVAAAATATLSTIEDQGLAENAARMGERLQSGLAEAELDVRDVRGRGLMVGIEVKRGSNRVLRDLALEQQILALPAGRSVLRLLPPLMVTDDHVDRLLEGVSDVLAAEATQ